MLDQLKRSLAVACRLETMHVKLRCVTPSKEAADELFRSIVERAKQRAIESEHGLGECLEREWKQTINDAMWGSP